MADDRIGFYPTDNEILKFSDSPDDIHKLRFNHYIVRKENIQRSKGGLPKGQFYFAESTAANDLNVTRGVIRGLVRLFRRLKIIAPIYRPPKGSREPSIFQYNQVTYLEPINDQKANHEENHDSNHDSNHDEDSNTNGLNDTANHDNNHDGNHDVNPSKKENEKQLLKTNCAFFEKVWKEYPSKKGKSQISKTTQRKLSKVGEADLLKAISNYKSELEANQWKQPMNGSTFFNGRYQDYLPENFESTLPEQRRRTRILNEE